MKNAFLPFFIAIVASVPGMAGSAQQPSLNKMLDAVDRPSGWASTPVSDAQTVRPAIGNDRADAAAREFMHHHDAPSIRQNQVVPTYQGGSAAQLEQIQRQQANRPFVSRQIMKTLLESSVSGPASAATQPVQPKSFSGSTAYSDWQRSENEAIRARNYASKARYDQNQWNRKDAASRANSAANSARYASDRVYQASLQGDPTAKQYASKARAAADRARADANRARYNADTIR